jgi:hypothetical protein
MELNCVNRHQEENAKHFGPMRKRGKNEKREKKNYFFEKREKILAKPLFFFGAGRPHFQKGPFWPLSPRRKKEH